jgi:hypothetical protein
VNQCPLTDVHLNAATRQLIPLLTKICHFEWVRILHDDEKLIDFARLISESLSGSVASR